MIRQWLNAGRNRKAAKRHQICAASNGCDFGQFEQLEDKRCLAFVGFFDGITLDLVQTFDDGDVVVDNSGLGGAFRVTDNSGALTFVTATNVTVTMLDNTANQINFNANNTHPGDVTLNLGDGPRDVVFAGNGLPEVANVINGDLEINAGDGPQFVSLAPITFPVPIPHITQGNATFNLGDGLDTVYNNENFVTVGGDLTMTGVNQFIYTDFLFPVPLDAFLTVGGNVTMDTSIEDTESVLLEGGTFLDDDPMGPMRLIIGGNFTYIGGENIDEVFLNETYIMGDVNIDLGLGTPFFGNPQNVTTTLILPPILGGPYAQIDGDLTIVAGSSNLGNVVSLDGAFNGNTVSYTGGDLVDDVTYSLLGNQADVFAFMGQGDDTFTLNSFINELTIDFGNNDDTFVNNIGQFTFDADLLNFDFFDHEYTVGDDTLELTQLIDTGDVTIDNDGGISGIDWRVFTAIGGSTSTTPASNLILNMMENTGNDVFMDLINPVIASITMNLGDGARNIDFVGSSNNPLRDIVINAGLGIQNVELSVNAPLAVATLNIDLGEGFDTVDDDANNLMISEDLIFTGVNHFENDGILSVTRNVFIDSTVEIEDTLFANNNNMFVGSNFTYAGGDGRDEIRLNSAFGNSITGNTLINVGDNITGGTQHVLLNDSSTAIGGNLTVISTAGANPDNLLIDPATSIGGNMIVDLGDGTNDATLVGFMGGTIINYDGGSGVDTVNLGNTGNAVDATINLGAGNDIFTLEAVANIQPDTLIVDFGGGFDTFINLYGPFDFDAILLNLNGVSHNYDFDTDTLVSTQVAVTPTLTVDNNGPNQAIRFIDGGTSVLTPVTNLTVNMLDDSGTDLNLRLDNPLAGDLAINLGNGDRDLNMDGTDNTVGGSLSITGGIGAQLVNISVNAMLLVTNDASIDLGIDFDDVNQNNDLMVGGDLDLAGVNEFAGSENILVGGNFSMSTLLDNTDAMFNPTVGGSFTALGNFNYSGGANNDQVFLEDLFQVDGNLVVNLGDGNNFADFDDVGGTNTVIGGTTTVIGGSGADSVVTNPTQTIYGGSIVMNLGDGANTADIFGIFGGSSITYVGGSGVDLVTLGTTGNAANASISLGGGDDIFTLEAGTQILPGSLIVDFGDDDDTFINNYGLLDFSFSFLGLDGFNHVYFLGTDTLTSTQVSDKGPVTVDNNGAGNAIRFIDGGINELRPVTNLNINMLDNSGSELNIALDNLFAGDLDIDLGDGARDLNFTGAFNTIDGSLDVSGGTGDQSVSLSDNSLLDLNSGGTFDLGLGNDSVLTSGNGLLVDGDLTLDGVNEFGGTDAIAILGNFSMSTALDNSESTFDPANGGSFFVSGNFDYTGNGLDDTLFLEDDFQVGGNLVVDMGDGTNLADFDDFGGTNATVSGTTTIDGGSGSDTLLTSPLQTSFGDDILINFGDGTNTANIFGSFGGSNIKYNGGVDSDNVTYATTGNLANVNIKLKAGDDMFTLEPGADIASSLLRVDFGGGNDSFVNNYGSFDFNASLLNWHGYDRFYDFPTDSWNIQQVMDTGPITLDNNGTGNAIRLLNGFTTEMTTATNVRLIMLDNTDAGVTVDLDSHLAGELVVQLRDGFREVNFTGSDNSIGGLLRIEAADNTQLINLAVNADLSVGASLVVNGRDGFDTVDDGANNITVGGAMILRNINSFEVTNTLTVGGDFGMNNLLDGTDTFFYNLGTMNLLGSLTFLAAEGVDDVFFNGVTNINDFAFFHIGDAMDAGRAQRIVLNGVNLDDYVGIVAGTSWGGNEISTDAAAVIGGDMVINLGSSASFNQASLLGTFNGANGSFQGGSFIDQLTLGMSASGMNYSALMGDGDDTVIVQPTLDVSFLYLDFGPGSDTLVDNLGMPWPFPSTIGNLP